MGPKGKPCDGGSDGDGDSCQGTITFEQISVEECKISWNLTGCGAEGEHGFHVHEKADFTDGCVSAGPHYNPHNKDHGAPGNENRHVGDLGNITVDAEGRSQGEMVDGLIKLEGEFSVIGRSVMIHADPDDLGCGDNSNGKTSKTTGNAGARIACGEIKLVQAQQDGPDANAEPDVNDVSESAEKDDVVEHTQPAVKSSD